jgi:hypothetical protein
MPSSAGASISAPPTPATRSSGPAGGGLSAAAMGDMATRIAEAKKKVAAAQTKVGTNPYMVRADTFQLEFA